MTVFADTWDSAFETVPADTDLKSQGAGKIRGHKVGVRERLEVDHSWAGDADDGAHKQVTFVNPLGADPSTVADQGYMYTKNVGGVVELFWKDESGNVLQLTTVGALNGAAITGEIRLWSTATAPTGWVKCDGTSYDSVGDTTFAALFAVIGTTYGGAGAADFDVPDLRGRTAIGAGTGDAGDATAHALADKEGTETHTLIEAELAAHDHDYEQREPQLVPGGTGVGINIIGGTDTKTTTSTGGGNAHNNLQPSLTLNYIIKK